MHVISARQLLSLAREDPRKSQSPPHCPRDQAARAASCPLRHFETKSTPLHQLRRLTEDTELMLQGTQPRKCHSRSDLSVATDSCQSRFHQTKALVKPEKYERDWKSNTNSQNSSEHLSPRCQSELQTCFTLGTVLFFLCFLPFLAWTAARKAGQWRRQLLINDINI